MRPSFSRSYGGILPSSLTIVLPLALVFSTRPPVSVWGTGTVPTHNEAFLGSMGSVTSALRLGIASQALWGPDLPGPRPTRLPRDNQRPGSPTLLRPSVAARHRWFDSSEDSLLVPDIGIDADTVVLEYQPAVHRLRLSASP